MSNKLKIYGCTGVGETDNTGLYKYWLDNTKTVSNTQAVNRLLATINYKYVQATYQRGLSNEQIAQLLDDIDILSICLYYAKEYANDPTQLHHAGIVIGALVNKGIFKYESVDGKERDSHLDDLFTKVEDLMNEDYKENKDFMQWWKSDVEDAEVVGMSDDEQTTITDALKESSVSAVGDADDKTIFDDPDIGNYLTNAGTYFLYTYFTEEQYAKITTKRNVRIFKRKAITQNNLRKYCTQVFIQKAYGDASYLDTLIRTGIIKDFGADPETVCEDIATRKRDLNGSVSAAIALTVAQIVKIIIVAIGAFVAIVKAIVDAIAKVKIAKYESLNQEAVEDSCPNEDDYDGLNMGKSLKEIINDIFGGGEDGEDSGGGLLLAGGIAVAAYLLFRK